ncbi:hypothetical protein HDU76_012764 [Blyttiomyces sp. JEL0837]|nr:hypothetical protein HDU76_012764 [Blyttiomyces sp. JEL0837]
MKMFEGGARVVNGSITTTFQELGVFQIGNAAKFKKSDNFSKYNVTVPKTKDDVRNMVGKVFQDPKTHDFSTEVRLRRIFYDSPDALNMFIKKHQRNQETDTQITTSQQTFFTSLTSVANKITVAFQSMTQTQEQVQHEQPKEKTFMDMDNQERELWIAKLSLCIFAELNVDRCRKKLEMRPEYPTALTVARECSEWFQRAISLYNTNPSGLHGHFHILVDFFKKVEGSAYATLPAVDESRREVTWEKSSLDVLASVAADEAQYGPAELPAAAEKRKGAKRSANRREEQQREQQSNEDPIENSDEDEDNEPLRKKPAKRAKKSAQSQKREGCFEAPSSSAAEESMEGEHEEEEVDVDELRAENVNLSKRNQELDEHYADLRATCKTQKNYIEKLHNEREMLRQQLHEAQNRVANLEHHQLQLGSELQHVAEKSDWYKEGMESSQRECAELRSLIATASGSLNTLNATTVEKTWDLVTNKLLSQLRHGKYIAVTHAYRFFESSTTLGTKFIKNRLRAAVVAATGAVTDEDMTKASGDRIKSFVTGYLQGNEARLAKQLYCYLLHVWFDGREVPDVLQKVMKGFSMEMDGGGEIESVKPYFPVEEFYEWKKAMEGVMEKLAGKPGCRHSAGWEVAYLEIVERLVQMGIQVGVVSPDVWMAVPKIAEDFDFSYKRAQIGVPIGEEDGEGGSEPFCIMPALYGSTVEGESRRLRKACGAQ